MAKPDPHIAAHLEWIGFVRPTGLVVSPPALVRAGAILNQRDTEGQRLLRECVQGVDDPNEGNGSEPWLPDFRSFATAVLGWNFSARGYAGTDELPIPPELEVTQPDSGGVLRPDFAVRSERTTHVSSRHGAIEIRDEKTGEGSVWQLLVFCLERGEDFDRISRDQSRANGSTETSPHGRMERLLRRTGVPAGLLFNGRALRLISAPKGENSGWLDFHVVDMLQTAGRPISSAMRELLSQNRLLLEPRNKRLAALLEDSRKYQNEVSERLAQQVLHALYELLRGFQAAHDASKGVLLDQPLKDAPDEVYRGLLTVVLRLVFLLYAEERDMLPQDDTFVRAYSLASLYERLREDAALHPDTMDQRYGAYAQLIVLTRMVHDGARSGRMSLPPRHGALFDPDRYRFLEGRGAEVGGARQLSERIEPPLVPDGTIYRVLEKLIVLDGERISYRALDVEHIGSVYETMMGFRLETATGQSLAVKTAKKHGAPATVDIEACLREPLTKRVKWLADATDRKLTDKLARGVREAETLEALHATLDPMIDRDATPDRVARGAIILQPSQERRRSGSHYTPRELTEPIVRRTLEPILKRLGGEDAPTPGQILDLKVCDPAMGSGAFLVEACRQLGDALVESWHVHDAAPDIPSDENEVVFARRQVAQRCLYGVDRNPAAVDLAKLSLWLVTLAKDHPLTFLDHALRHGDSLVGLSTRQLQAFHWKADAPDFDAGFEALRAGEHLDNAVALRRRIREADEGVADWELRRLWDEAKTETDALRRLGDLALAAFFEARKPKEREALRARYAADVVAGDVDKYASWLDELRDADPPLAPFHWEIEFPEVFERANPGFDAMAGNPPFAGSVAVVKGNVDGYTDWLRTIHTGSLGKCDLVAHFFRRTFNVLRRGGAFGLIATNTIAQGDTRASGLQWICNNGGEIYRATRRLVWPNVAAVIVSVVHVVRGKTHTRVLDGNYVGKITAYLFHCGGHDEPFRLIQNARKSFLGNKINGMGFTFDDNDRTGTATSLSRMSDILRCRPSSRDAIFPFIGGQELNSSPTQSTNRYVIDFRDKSENACRSRWPELLAVVERNVKPRRLSSKGKSKSERESEVWWQHAHRARNMHDAIRRLSRVLAISRVGNSFAFAFLPTGLVYNAEVVVFPFEDACWFSILQSRVHETWTRFFGSTLRDDLRYTPTKCFETFPFPMVGSKSLVLLDGVGGEYLAARRQLMIDNNEGMTKTYNRFHDPYENDPRLDRLRDLHAAMDRAVLDVYGWHDIPTDCDFLLDYKVDEAEWGNRNKPYRYRWPDEVHDEILARLLELNAERTDEEARRGLTKPVRPATPPHPQRNAASQSLWEVQGGADDDAGRGCEHG